MASIVVRWLLTFSKVLGDHRQRNGRPLRRRTRLLRVARVLLLVPESLSLRNRLRHRRRRILLAEILAALYKTIVHLKLAAFIAMRRNHDTRARTILQRDRPLLETQSQYQQSKTQVNTNNLTIQNASAWY